MASIPVADPVKKGAPPVAPNPAHDTSGIALFMVMSAMSVLAILVSEFAYVAQINQKVAFDALDQVKAHYLAKSGLKLSLLRLKAYQTISQFTSGGGAGAAIGAVLPKSILEKIWNFPFFYPIPANIPGLSVNDKDQIDKFTKSSGLDGQFSALIESESSRLNLNMILGPYVPGPGPSASPSPTASPVAGSSPNPAASFDPTAARKSLYDYLFNLLNAKFESDEYFASEYRDLRLEELVDNMAAWADVTFEKPEPVGKNVPKFKRAPFYTITELHMVPLMDDQLYDLFTPSLTASTTPGINVNSMQDNTLRALVPQITKDEATDFFKFRDSQEDDNYFKTADDFFNYLLKSVGAFRGDQNVLAQYKQDLATRNIRIVTSETNFKITVQAQTNQATRVFETWVTLTGSQTGGGTPTGGPSPTPSAAPLPGGNPASPQNLRPPRPDSGLKVTYMRIS